MQMLKTTIPSLSLGPLTEHHSSALYELIQQNRSHLTAHGDYTELVALPMEALAAELTETSNRTLRFGIFLEQELIGRVDLIAVDPPRYGLGYWVGGRSTGKGYATAALQALLDFARAELRATDVFAGVTHGNSRSTSLLERTGFVPIATFEKYTRFRRNLVER